MPIVLTIDRATKEIIIIIIKLFACKVHHVDAPLSVQLLCIDIMENDMFK